MTKRRSLEVFSFVGVAARAAKTRRSNPPADSSRWSGVAPSGLKGVWGVLTWWVIAGWRGRGRAWSG